MIISPQRIAKEGIVSQIDNPKDQIQQNGIDLTLRSICNIDWGIEPPRLYKSERKIQDRTVIEPEDDGVITLQEGIYDVEFNEYVKIPNGMCAQIVQRSTLNRTGNFITAGVYDAGFENRIGAILHVTRPIELQIGARLAQIVFFEAEEGLLYEGVYKEKSLI